MNRKHLKAAGFLILGVTALLGPSVADDWRHWGEIAGLLLPLAAGAQFLIAGTARNSALKARLAPALAVLLAGALAGMALDQVAIVAPATVALSFGLMLLRKS